MSEQSIREAMKRVKAILEAVGIVYRTQMDFVRHDLAALEAGKPAPLFEVLNALPALLDAAEERERLAADNAALRECLREIVELEARSFHGGVPQWRKLAELCAGEYPDRWLRAAELCGLAQEECKETAPLHPTDADIDAIMAGCRPVAESLAILKDVSPEMRAEIDDECAVIKAEGERDAGNHPVAPDSSGEVQP